MSGLTTGLVRRDLLDLEQRLRDSLYRVLPFEAHAVYFPRQTRSKEPEWLPDEGKLLLPLVRHGELLGVFMANRMDTTKLRKMVAWVCLFCGGFILVNAIRGILAM